MLYTISCLMIAGAVIYACRTVVIVRKLARQEKEGQKLEAERIERELKQKRDHQFNHGRYIHNWLKRELEQYADVGIVVKKIEQNGESFSIQIIRKDDSTMQGFIQVLQLDYDFVKYQEPYVGHIHYGSYGPDILVWFGDNAPKHGLGMLVLDVVRNEAERVRSSK